MADPDVSNGGTAPRLLTLAVADEPEAWAAAGFAVDGTGAHAEVRLGDVRLRLLGPAEGRGITGWTVSGLDAPLGPLDLDGLPTEHVEAPPASAPATRSDHPNGAVGLDHVVVFTPALDRTIARFEGVGVGCRRIRDTTAPDGSPMQQAFFRFGPTVIEVVSRPGTAPTHGPSTWFGLAVDVDDLDASAARLGPALGRVKAAVQRGRRIATLRQRDLGLGVAVAVMDDHADR